MGKAINGSNIFDFITGETNRVFRKDFFIKGKAGVLKDNRVSGQKRRWGNHDYVAVQVFRNIIIQKGQIRNGRDKVTDGSIVWDTGDSISFKEKGRGSHKTVKENSEENILKGVDVESSRIVFLMALEGSTKNGVIENEGVS